MSKTIESKIEEIVMWLFKIKLIRATSLSLAFNDYNKSWASIGEDVLGRSSYTRIKIIRVVTTYIFNRNKFNGFLEDLECKLKVKDSNE